MQSKLTLYLDEQLLEQATLYANEHGKTLSQIIADYLALLAASTAPSTEVNDALPPITRSLLGVLQQSDVDEHDYHEHLEKKYQ